MSVAPRSQNPHLLPQDVKIVSRAELFSKEDDLAEVHDETVHLLNSLLAQSLEYERPKKRRRVEDEGYEYIIQEPQLFRLVSGPPALISTEPAPPPPSFSREPDAEDSPEAAALRETRARQSAVDADWVLRESKHTPLTTDAADCKRVKQALPSPPPLIVISTLQSPRCTRPPLPTHLYSHAYPYSTTGAFPVDSQPKAKCCSIVDAEPELQSKSRSRRRRKHIERPPPAFWRPNPALKGKCQGYAYGYPSSFAAMEDWDSRGIIYQRDKMRRIDACDVHPRALF